MKITTKSLLCLSTLLAVLGCVDTAQAQSNTLTANPSQLTFNTQSGVIPTPQTLLITSSTGTVGVTATAFSSSNWLVINPTGGSTPLSINVSIGPSAPTSGTDTGFINVSSAGSFVSVPVVLNANSQGGASPITASPNSLSFSFAANSTVPASQNVALSSNSASVTSFTATPNVNNGGTWLTVSPQSGGLPNTLQVTVNPSALPPGGGPFSAAVAISAPGTTGISLPVVVTVGGTPAIKVTPSQFSFAYQLGTNAPASQTLSIQSSTGANVGFTASAKTANCGNNWIVLTQQSGATPSTIGVQINTSGLVAGNCSGEIDISAPTASNPSVVIPVSLLVSTNPLLQVPSTGPTFTYQIGSNTPPAAQNVQITSSSTPLNFTASATPINGGPNFVVVSPVSGTTPQALALTVNSTVLSSLGPGTYSETVTVSSNNAGNSPQTFPVTLVVNSNAILTASVQSLNFNYQIGQAAPQNQTFTVSSTGGPLNFQVAASTTSCAGFLSAAANGGANGITFGAQNVVVVSVNVNGIMPQSCSGTITLTVPGSTSPPLVIPVTLNVTTTALLNVSSAAINVTALVGPSVTTQTISVTSTDNTVLPFTATASTNPVGLTWLSVTPNGGNTPNNLVVTVNAANLAVGTYTGSILVSSTAPNIPAQSIPVTLVIVSSNVSANPANVTFVQSLGGPLPATQTVQIAGVPSGTIIGVVSTELNGTNVAWLSASASGNTVAITTNGSQLPIGAYSGVVTVIVPGAGNSPLYIPVALTVGPAVSLSVFPGTVNFAYQAGSGTFQLAQSVQVTSTGGSVPFSAAFNPGTGGPFITLSPTGGNTPSTLGLSLNQAVVSTLAVGNYSATVTVSSPNAPGGNQTIVVNLAVTAAPPPPAPAVLAVTSSASFVPGPVSPGELVTIFGTNMGPFAGIGFTPANNRVGTILGGTMVTFDGVPAPLLFVSGNQINAIVPYEVASNSVTSIAVITSGGTSVLKQVQVVATVPAIFSANQSGNGQGAILNQDLSSNNAVNPATRGTVVAIYATGEGSLTPFAPTGSISGPSLPLPKPIANVTVTIGGQPAQVSYAGEAPGLVSGVLQVNAMVPTNIGTGPQTVVLTIGQNTNAQQTITVAVQ